MLNADWQQYSLNDSSRAIVQVYRTSEKVMKFYYENYVGTLINFLLVKIWNQVNVLFLIAQIDLHYG